jgi:hypothetical protein
VQRPLAVAAEVPSAAWRRRNRRVLAGFGPFLILAGVTGLFGPDPTGLFSYAVPYDVFHILAGAIGVALALRGGRGPSGFNFVFGTIDLYQAVAGVAGLFPAAWFALRPADHVIHVVLGLALVALGARGLRERA